MPKPARPTNASHAPQPEVANWVVATAAGLGWAWAVALVSLRQHDILDYKVLAFVPPAWGAVAISGPMLLGMFLAAAVLAVVARQSGGPGSIFPPATRWLLAAWVIPGLDVLRAAGLEVPLTSFEPVFLTAVTGAAAGVAARDLSWAPTLQRRAGQFPWWAMALVLTFSAAGWWYWQGLRAHHDYLLGYNDFGIYATRVANTWHGRGFLLEMPGLPAFYDHFNPSLALLAPLWGLWPDARLFILLQAVGLALPALLIYGIARCLKAGPGTACVWAAVYLVFPAVGQLNLSYSYGWHPVTMAMLFLLAAAYALLRSRRWLAAALAVIACGWQEDVLIVVGCLTLAMAIEAWRGRRNSGRRAGSALDDFAGRLSPRTWLIAAALSAAAFLAIYRFAPLARFQTGRFSALGNSPLEIALSPLLRASVFWRIVLRQRTALFLLLLSVPLGPGNLLRGWRIAWAAALPLGVLVAWNYLPAQSIAFQYCTMLIPVLVLAAMAGAADRSPRNAAEQGGEQHWPRAQGLATGGATALAAGLAASVAFGAMPWSSPTLTGLLAATYGAEGVLERRIEGSPGNAALERTVALVGTPRSRVLASGRIASHLLNAERVVLVEIYRYRRGTLQAEVGRGRSPMELFDWIVIDTQERFSQSMADVRGVLDEARDAGFQPIESSDGVLLWGRGGTRSEPRKIGPRSEGGADRGREVS